MSDFKVEDHLRAGELKLYENALDAIADGDSEAIFADDIKNALESLARCRAVMKEREWRKRENDTYICDTCNVVYLPDIVLPGKGPGESRHLDYETKPGRIFTPLIGEGKRHAPDCAWAACLAGVGEKKVCSECNGEGMANYGFNTGGDPIDEMCRKCTPGTEVPDDKK